MIQTVILTHNQDQKMILWDRSGAKENDPQRNGIRIGTKLGSGGKQGQTRVLIYPDPMILKKLNHDDHKKKTRYRHIYTHTRA